MNFLLTYFFFALIRFQTETVELFIWFINKNKQNKQTSNRIKYISINIRKEISYNLSLERINLTRIIIYLNAWFNGFLFLFGYLFTLCLPSILKYNLSFFFIYLFIISINNHITITMVYKGKVHSHEKETRKQVRPSYKWKWIFYCENIKCAEWFEKFSLNFFHLI